MQKYRITLEDLFSFTTLKRETMLNDSSVKSIQEDIERKRIVYGKITNGIHFTYVVRKIEKIN